jgi:hypothetical protein
VAVFLALAAIDHLLVASPGVHSWYERGLSRRANYTRWLEYSVSASVMIVLFGLFVGIRDLAAVVAVFAVNTAVILFGMLMERQQRPGAADWRAFWFGSLVGIVPWALIAVYVAQPAQVPGFVYAITIIQFVLFFSFAVNMVLQYARLGRWRDYVHGEVVYIVLSFTAKSLLAWLIFARGAACSNVHPAAPHHTAAVRPAATSGHTWIRCACRQYRCQASGQRGGGSSSLVRQAIAAG